MVKFFNIPYLISHYFFKTKYNKEEESHPLSSAMILYAFLFHSVRCLEILEKTIVLYIKNMNIVNEGSLKYYQY